MARIIYKVLITSLYQDKECIKTKSLRKIKIQYHLQLCIEARKDLQSTLTLMINTKFNRPLNP